MALDLAEFEQAFKSESAEQLEQAENAVLKLEKGPDPEAINQLFRAIHTIKGNSGIVKATAVTALSHALETRLNSIRKGSSSMDSGTVDLVLKTCDRLREMVQALGTSASFSNNELIVQLEGAKTERADAAKPSGTSEKPAGLRIARPPQAMVEKARKDGIFLAFVSFDPLRASLTTVHQVHSFLDCVREHGMVHKPGTRLTGDTLFLYFFMFSAEDPAALIASCGGPVDAVQILQAPESAGAMRAARDSFAPESSSQSSAQSSLQGAGLPAAPETPPTAAPSAMAVPAGAVPAAGLPADQFLKIPTALADDLINASGESIVARNELLLMAARLGDRELAAVAKKMSRLVSYLQDRIMRVRLQKMESVFSRLPRLVRDTAHVTGKDVELIVQGSDVELDKNLLAAVADPLMHIVRNSVDHGIEKAELRRSSGKPERGRLSVQAALSGGNVIITVEDDGRGLDLERLRSKAIERGILSAEQAKAATPDQVYDFIFLPGFSTAERITETSGRGVGMDVVRSNIHRMGGRVDLESRPGLGCTVKISLPQTISIVNCLLAATGASKFALLQKDVDEVLRVDPSLLSRMEKGSVYELRGEILPVLDLHEMLQLETKGKDRYLLVMGTDRYRYGMLFDRIFDQAEFVLKPIGELFSELQHFAGAGVLGDGEVVVILDADGLGRKAGLEPRKAEAEVHHTEKSQQRVTYFLFDLHGQQYAIPAGLKPGLRRLKSGDVFFQVDQESILEDGQILPVIRLDRYFGSEDRPDQSRMFALTVRCGEHRVALIASRILALVSKDVDVALPSSSTPGILGEGIVNNRPTAFLDVDAVVTHQVNERFHAKAVNSDAHTAGAAHG